MNVSPQRYAFQKLCGLCVFAYLLSGCIAPTTREAAVSATSNASAQPLTLAVWDFDNNAMAGGDLDYLGRALSEALLVNLAQTPSIRLLERVKLRKVLEEQHLGSNQLASEESMLKLGRLAGANHMAFGSFMAIGNQMRVDVRVVEVETSLVKFSEDAVSPVKDVVKEMPVIAQHIAAKFAAGGATGKGITSDLSLWKQYAEGIALMDKHLYEQAIVVFTAVLKSDPGFKAAEQQIKLALELQTRQ